MPKRPSNDNWSTAISTRMEEFPEDESDEIDILSAYLGCMTQEFYRPSSFCSLADYMVKAFRVKDIPN